MTNNNSTMIAVVGTDGVRPVVWGLGADIEAALADADEASNDAGLCPVAVTSDVAQRIRAGVIDCKTLGIEVKASGKRVTRASYMLTTDTITTEQIQALETEAGSHGDDAMVRICQDALIQMRDNARGMSEGHEKYGPVAQCVRAINDALAARAD